MDGSADYALLTETLTFTSAEEPVTDDILDQHSVSVGSGRCHSPFIDNLLSRNNMAL